MNVLNYPFLILRQKFSQQTLERTPESSMVLTSAELVNDYAQVKQTPLVLLYFLAFGLIHRMKSRKYSDKALDLCCGPGYGTRLLPQFLQYAHVTGIDLSEEMLEVARRNAAQIYTQEVIDFCKHDVRDLSCFKDGAMDLVTCMNGMHHLSTQDDVIKTLTEIERVGHPESVLFVMDPVRLKTQKLTDVFVKKFGKIYLDLDLPHFYDEYYHSLHAAWTEEELKTFVPPDTSRTWYYLKVPLLPVTQFLFSPPQNHNTPFHCGWPVYPEVDRHLKNDWAALRFFVRQARLEKLTGAREK